MYHFKLTTNLTSMSCEPISSTSGCFLSPPAGPALTIPPPPFLSQTWEKERAARREGDVAQDVILRYRMITGR